MDDVRLYWVRVRGVVEEADIALFSPPGLTVEADEAGDTRLVVRADQAGLIGLIRHLHAMGLILAAVRLVDETP